MSLITRIDSPSHPLRLVVPITAMLAALLLPYVALAEPLDTPTESSLSRRVERGLAGVFLGVLEIPGTMVTRTREQGPAAGVALGLTEGVGRFVAREVLGAYQLVAAPFGDAPDPYPNLLDPEFPWDHFEGETQLAAVEPANSFAEEAEEFGWIRGVDVREVPGALVVTFPGDLVFEVGSARIAEAAKPRLIGLAETLFRHPQLEIEVQGYADATGGVEANQRLSEQRAAAVRDFLVGQGLSPRRILVTGYGTSRPVASNDTPQGRRANRRVEVELHKPVALSK